MTQDHDRRASDKELFSVLERLTAIEVKLDESLKFGNRMCDLHESRTSKIERLLEQHATHLNTMLGAAEKFEKHENDERWKWRTSLTALAALIVNVAYEWIKKLMMKI